MSKEKYIYDDDFLDSLMEEVSETHGSSGDLVDNSGELDSGEIGLSVDNESTNVDNESTGIDSESTNIDSASSVSTGLPGGLVGRMAKPTEDSAVSQGGNHSERRRGGLLSQLGEPSKSEDDETLESEGEHSSRKESGDGETFVSTGVGGGSLLGLIGGETSSEVERVTDEETSVSSSEEESSSFIDFSAEKIVEETTDIEESEPVGSGNSGLDSLDSMLDDLANDDEDVEEMSRRAELDPEVEVPLEKPGMDEVIVTSDGRSLAEVLPGMRGGQRKRDEVISDIRNQKRVVDVQGNKFSDNRYTKHVERAEKERAVDEERIALSMKFLQRNAKFSEQEKIIMRNLGLNNEQLAKVMSSQELSMKEKEEVLALGRYGSEKHFKGRRYRTTVGDSAMLEFLTKFKFANTRILRWISNEPQGRTWRKLNRLRNSGLVESKSLIGVPDLWAATPSGVAISGYAYEPGLRPMPKMMSISSNMGVNYLAACLWFNTVNVLNLDDFPAHNRVIALQEDGRDRVRGEMLVSEYELRSSLGKEINPQSTTMRTLGDQRLYDIISSNVRREIEDWEAGGRVGESPEFSLGNEYMWVLYPTSQLTLSYHVPDLVVKRERGVNGEPRSIAVEMERFEKSNDRYDKIMLAYKLDEHLYEEVVWVTPSTRVARALERAANSVGFDRYSIIPIITESGVYSKQDIWMI